MIAGTGVASAGEGVSAWARSPRKDTSCVCADAFWGGGPFPLGSPGGAGGAQNLCLFKPHSVVSGFSLVHQLRAPTLGVQFAGDLFLYSVSVFVD